MFPWIVTTLETPSQGLAEWGRGGVCMNLVTGPGTDGAGPTGVSRGLPGQATLCRPPMSSRLQATPILPSQVDHPDLQPSAKLYHHHCHHSSFQNIPARHRAPSLAAFSSLPPPPQWLSSRSPPPRLELVQDPKGVIKPQLASPCRAWVLALLLGLLPLTFSSCLVRNSHSAWKKQRPSL